MGYLGTLKMVRLVMLKIIIPLEERWERRGSDRLDVLAAGLAKRWPMLSRHTSSSRQVAFHS